MFYEFTAKSGEAFILNINCIVGIFTDKNGSVIVTIDGCSYKVINTYNELCSIVLSVNKSEN